MPLKYLIFALLFCSFGGISCSGPQTPESESEEKLTEVTPPPADDVDPPKEEPVDSEPEEGGEGGGSEESPEENEKTYYCKVEEGHGSSWYNGYVVNYTLRLVEGCTKGWSLEFALPPGHTITSVWNADLDSDFDRVTVTHKSYNKKISAKRSQSFGLQVHMSENQNLRAAAFKLNGQECAFIPL